MGIRSRYDLDEVPSDTDVIGDVDEWIAVYESGLMAEMWGEMLEKATVMLEAWRDRYR